MKSNLAASVKPFSFHQQLEMFANIFYEMNFNPSDDFNEFKIVVDYYNA